MSLSTKPKSSSDKLKQDGSGPNLQSSNSQEVTKALTNLYIYHLGQSQGPEPNALRKLLMGSWRVFGIKPSLIVAKFNFNGGPSPSSNGWTFWWVWLIMGRF